MQKVVNAHLVIDTNMSLLSMGYQSILHLSYHHIETLPPDKVGFLFLEKSSFFGDVSNLKIKVTQLLICFLIIAS